MNVKTPKVTIKHSNSNSRYTVATIGSKKIPQTRLFDDELWDQDRVLYNLWADIYHEVPNKLGDYIAYFRGVSVCDPRDTWNAKVGEKVAAIKARCKFHQHMQKKYVNLGRMLRQYADRADKFADAHKYEAQRYWTQLTDIRRMENIVTDKVTEGDVTADV